MQQWGLQLHKLQALVDASAKGRVRHTNLLELVATYIPCQHHSVDPRCHAVKCT